MDDSGNRDAVRFLDILDSFDLVQHIHQPTHKKGHTLDLFLSRASDDMVKAWRSETCILVTISGYIALYWALSPAL